MWHAIGFLLEFFGFLWEGLRWLCGIRETEEAETFQNGANAVAAVAVVVLGFLAAIGVIMAITR